MMHGDDVVLCVLPLFHVYGLNAVLGGMLRHRAKLVLVERFDPHETLILIDDEACSVVPVAPPVFAYWQEEEHLEEHLGPVRLILCGSAPLSTELVERFTARTGIPVHQGYGLTEAAPVVTSTLCSAVPQLGSVGAALPGVEIRLVDESGHEPEGDDPGEIQIRGENLFSGYWPDGDGGPDEDGWWSTGDVGFLDPAGDLFLVDRLKELVIVSGFNVYPTEVEDVIEEVDGVEDVAVIGVEDPLTGEAVVAYVHRARRRPGGRSPTPYAPTAPTGWRASSSRPASRSSTSCPRRSPGRCRRAGCAASSGAAPSGSWSDRPVTAPRHPLLAPRLPPLRDARAVIEQVCADLGEEYVELSIDDDPELQSRFGEEIPVTFVDGRQHDFWRVDEARLRAALGGRSTPLRVAHLTCASPPGGRLLARFCSRVHKLLQ